MKHMTEKYPNVSRMILVIVLFVIVLLISGIVNRGVIKQYAPYASCILLFVVTWFLLKTEKKSLSGLGLNFSLKNVLLLPLGVLIGVLALFVAKYLRALYLGETFEISTSIDYWAILMAFYFILPQVATEEFLFRGYLFKKTIELSNVIVANIIFSILFMLIHVLDEGVLSNTGMLILLVVSIPVGHLLFATALLKSKTLFFPIGIHLGNNWATRHLISNVNDGSSFLFVTNANTFETWTPFIGFLIIFNGFFLLVTFVIWKWDRLKTYSSFFNYFLLK
ncbi:lysostaphin resistance A-like protein [Psychroserpens sp. XS_ASV72]|uniref:CPBP family intramembrane glutamic endopeptidase n=1 Tax=Psychroserpens sp. XS_ASV72 TaxID=3241293 RepID=UPI003518F359